MKKEQFLAKFNRYMPDSEAQTLLAGLSDYSIRVDKERRFIEITMYLESPQAKERIYAVEDGIRDAYGLAGVMIITKYPPESFSFEYIHEVVKGAYRRGSVSRGFFNSYNVEKNAGAFTFYIDKSQGSADLLYDAGTDKLMENIIKEEFGLEYKIQIVSARGEFDNEEYFNNQNTILDALAAENTRIAREAAKQRAQEEKEKKEAEEAEKPPMIRTLSTSELTFEKTDESVKCGNMTFDISAPELLYGEEFGIDPTPLRNVEKPERGLCVLGQVNSFESKLNRNGDKTVMTIGITDNDSSINVKMILENDEAEPIISAINKASRSIKRGVSTVVTLYYIYLAVYGSVKTDKFDNELVMSPSAIMKIKRIERTDNAPEKRVELHMHTNMSTMDALTFPEFAIETAESWGWDAIAITDHGNAQAYPLIKDAAAKKHVKPLYGMEAYFVDDTARAAYGDAKVDFANDIMTVFDIETTGLSSISCKITEIGAVKIQGGEVIDVFNTFADPEGHIPEEITKLTGITDDMVKGAPSQREAVEAFLEFAGDTLLIAHNAGFDIGFVRKVCDDNRTPFKNSYLDTVSLSRYVNPELKKHTLDSVAEFYKLGDFNHHRASDDAEMLARIFFKMVDRLSTEGIRTLEEVNSSMAGTADPKRLKPYHMIILVQNMVGLKNLYKLISSSYLEYFSRYPRIPKTMLDTMRDGLIIGSACEAGELYRAIIEGKSEAEIKEIASYYDYLEIQPICNNRFLVENGTLKDDEAIKDINRRIVALGDELGKPVCATCDSHFLNKEDEIYRKILLKGQKFSDADRDVGLYLRTTDEMLEEFEYLGKEKAYEIVVTNTRKIADSIERILPIPDGAYTPKMEGAEEELQKLCWDRAKEWYGYNDEIPKIVSDRLEKELTSIISNGFAVLYIIAQRLVWYSESQGYLVGSRGSVGSSFVATMAGISEVNPLPPHYRCPKCRYNEFITDGSYGSGFDMPTKYCPHCGTKMVQDGHDIPFETFLGFHGDKSPDIDLNFSGEVQGKVHKYTEELFGAENVFKAGTLGTLASKTAYGYVMKYLEEKHITVNKAEINRLVNGCVGVKRTTGQHPGGIVVIPREYSVYDFTPVQHPADDPNSDIVTTHFPFAYLHDTILKLDELGHDVPTKYKWLEKYTGMSVLDVPMNDPQVYKLFVSLEPLGLKQGDIDCVMGTYALPEFGTRFVQKMLEEAQPKNFADLLQISGVSHGTDVWTGNAQDLIKDGVCTISEVIGTRDSIMLSLIRYGLDNSMAFTIMESVRKGKGLKPEWEAAMRENNVPEWYIESCKKIKYMFPKAHAAAYVMSAIRIAWFKIYKPLEFYAAYFSVAPGGFDATIVTKGRKAVLDEMNAIAERVKNKTSTPKDADTESTLQLVNESMARGVQYLPVNLNKSGAYEFIPENGKIRIPFSALPGLGESAAASIVRVREEGEIFSREELRIKAGLTKAVMDLLDQNGVLEGLSDTNQISLF